MIKSVYELQQGIHIDLTGQNGNAFYLLGLARKLARELDKDGDEITARMTAGDYDNLIDVFDQEFGDIVTLYR